MPNTPSAPNTMRVATLFGWLSGIFVLVFAGIVGWLAHDQAALLESVSRLRTQVVPESIEQQRLARNLETLRLEGERVLAGPTPDARYQAMFVVSLMASHPSIVSNPRARDVAAETEQFLGRVARSDRPDAAALAEWEQISRRLSLAADDITVDGASLARTEAGTMDAVIEASRGKLLAALLLTAIFIVAVLLLLHRRLVQPLQQIDAALLGLNAHAPGSRLPEGSLREIRAIEAAIVQLREMLREHEDVRGELEKLAATDMLTGLNNRRNFMALANAEVARAQRYGRPTAVALADLDHFKRVNDEHGHAAGDQVLKVFADLVQSSLRQADFAGRYGGEEFSFVFPETTPAEAEVLANRLRSQLESMTIPLPDGGFVRVTLSIGVADASSVPLEEALSAADQALYQAKSSGRNRVAIAPSMPLPLGSPERRGK